LFRVTKCDTVHWTMFV